MTHDYQSSVIFVIVVVIIIPARTFLRVPTATREQATRRTGGVDTRMNGGLGLERRPRQERKLPAAS